MCVFVRVLKPPNETLSESQPAPLATIMTTLLRTIGCQQNKTVVCSAVTLWALRQKKLKEKSEIKLWLYSGRGMAEVFSSFLLAVFLQLLHCCLIAVVAMRRRGRPDWSAVPLRQLAGGFESKEKTLKKSRQIQGAGRPSKAMENPSAVQHVMLPANTASVFRNELKIPPFFSHLHLCLKDVMQFFQMTWLAKLGF